MQLNKKATWGPFGDVGIWGNHGADAWGDQWAGDGGTNKDDIHSAAFVTEYEPAKAVLGKHATMSV